MKNYDESVYPTAVKVLGKFFVMYEKYGRNGKPEPYASCFNIQLCQLCRDSCEAPNAITTSHSQEQLKEWGLIELPKSYGELYILDFDDWTGQAVCRDCHKEKFDTHNRLYRKASDAIDKRLEDYFKSIYKGYKVSVIWSASPYDDKGLPVDILEDVAVEGKVKFFQTHDAFWEGDSDEGGNYESPVVENPTWFEVAKFANDMIYRTHDFHHVFLESVYQDKDVSCNNAVKVYKFGMGS